MLSGRGAQEPLIRFTGLGDFSELGVSIFFVISGFLVTASFVRAGAAGRYLANRCLRILPGLAVALVLTACVLGTLVSTLSAAGYFGRLQTWTYVARNLLLYPVTYYLSGVFAANPFPDAVNGSLWTLRLEFTFYLAILVLAAMRLLTPKALAVLTLGGFIAYAAARALPPGQAPIMVLLALRNGYLFIAGAALFTWREPMARLAVVWTGAAALAFAASLPSEALAPFVAIGVLPLLVIGVALRPLPVLRSAARFGDFSYGIYIYAFPVQQALMWWAGPQRLDIASFFGATLVCVLPLAAASWWLVEKPALGFKRRLVERRSSGPGAGAVEAPANP
jgi:peptidoglycan/LPS O-acetylase OafA/YrhL